VGRVKSVKPTDMKWHPAACIFPMLGEDELDALADDIRQHGLREPVVLFEGKVLDGRNRWMACKLAGKVPVTREFEGTKLDALAFVWSTNVQRRHLTSNQTASANAEREVLDVEYSSALEEVRKVAASNKGGDKRSKSVVQKIAPQKKDNSSLTDDKIAEAIGSNRTYVAASRKILAERPDLHEKVKARKLTIPQAQTEMRREEKRKTLEAKSKQVKTEFADQPLWTLINQDVIDGLQDVIDNHGPARLIFADPPYNAGVDYGDQCNDRRPAREYVDWCGS